MSPTFFHLHALATFLKFATKEEMWRGQFSFRSIAIRQSSTYSGKVFFLTAQYPSMIPQFANCLQTRSGAVSKNLDNPVSGKAPANFVLTSRNMFRSISREAAKLVNAGTRRRIPLWSVKSIV